MGAVGEPSHRWRVMQDLGLDSYDQYLSSPIWKAIRTLSMIQNNHRCIRCGDYASEVHHQDYHKDTMLGYRMGSLVPVCHNCHNQAHNNPDGSRRSLTEANRFLEVGDTPKPPKPKQPTSTKAKRKKRKKQAPRPEPTKPPPMRTKAPSKRTAALTNRRKQYQLKQAAANIPAIGEAFARIQAASTCEKR